MSWTLTKLILIIVWAFAMFVLGFITLQIYKEKHKVTYLQLVINATQEAKKQVTKKKQVKKK